MWKNTRELVSSTAMQDKECIHTRTHLPLRHQPLRALVQLEEEEADGPEDDHEPAHGEEEVAPTHVGAAGAVGGPGFGDLAGVVANEGSGDLRERQWVYSRILEERACGGKRE